ncbi:Methylmalonyl-CoA epimerase, mitochondrial [Armadillidium vulgare]|nr:Methylmalonyl-CoA epimerase, mitochondrial [Armadillidium vulgare]
MGVGGVNPSDITQRSNLLNNCQNCLDYDLLKELKTKFKISTSHAEKLQIMTLRPKSCSIEKTMAEFEVSQRMILGMDQLDVLKAKVSDPVSLPDHGVITVFVDVHNTKLELLKPLGERSPINNFLKKNKEGGMHHICFEVDNIKIAMRELKSKGIRCLSEEPRIGAHGKPVVFLHPKDCSGVLIELEEA